MKKLIVIFAIAIGFNASAQPVLTNNFSVWDNNTVVGWNGSATHVPNLTITQVTDGVVFGSAAVQLATAQQDQHRRFASDPVPIENNMEYNFKYFARGQGRIRVGVFFGTSVTDGASYRYSPYFELNHSDWIEINQSVVSAGEILTGQFIFSVMNTVESSGHIQIDSVSITTSSVEQVTIRDIQFTTSPEGVSPLVGQVVTTGGIVTGIRPNPNGGYFIQSGSGPWSGIYVFNPNNVDDLAIGDSLIITGEVEERFGNTQLTNIATFSKVSSGNNLPAPLTAPTGTLSTEPYEGVLVRAFEATCTAGPSTQNVWTLNDGSGDVFVGDNIYQHTPFIINSKYNVTGPLFFTFSQFRILPRFPQDVELVQPAGVNTFTENSISIYPNPATDFINIQLQNPAENVWIELSDLSGRTLKSLNALQEQNLQLYVADLSKGLYILKIHSARGVVSKRILLN